MHKPVHGNTPYFWLVASDLPIDNNLPRAERLRALEAPLEALLRGEDSGWANLANISAALMSASAWHWVGFYIVDRSKDNLVLGPFQGPIACTRLFKGRGVCAAAWQEGRIQVVPDVDSFPGHVACSSASKSEVVLPITSIDGLVVAVLDIDSAVADDFEPSEIEALKSLVEMVSSKWDQWTW